MYSVSDLQKLVQMLDYLGFAGNIAPPHSVVIGGGWVTPGASGTLFASNGPTVDPSFRTLGSLGIQPALGYTPAHAGANSDITSLSSLSTPLSIPQGGTGAATAALARAALGAAASGANTDIISLASPALGSATATTQARGTNNTDVATTAFVLRQATVLNILDYGGDNGGSVDNTAALNALLASAVQFAGRVVVYFPPGKYIFNSTITYTFPSAGATVVLTGAGPDTTELCWPSAGIGMQFNYLGAFNGVHIRDLSFTCGTTNTATAIFLNQTATSIPNPAVSNLNEFTNVNFRGSDGYVVNFVWAKAIDVFAVSMVNYSSCAFFGNTTGTQGVGVDLHGLNSGCQGVVSNFVNCVFTNMNIGIVYGDWYQGVAVSQCNFGGQIGIQAPIGSGGQDQLTVSNCQINCATAGMQLNQPIPGLMVSNNLIILQQTNARGITADNYGNFQIVGNQFGGPSLGLSNLGIYLKNASSGTISGGVITGNIFVSLTNAITLDTTSTKVNVQSNAYLNCTTGVTNSGTGNTIGGSSP